MKKFFLTIITSLIFGTVFLVPNPLYAQTTGGYKTESNPVDTTIGNPPLDNCPVRNGKVSNGSLFTPVKIRLQNGSIFTAGHCDPGYIQLNPTTCNWPGTQYGVDVMGNDLQEVILPRVHNHDVEWTHLLGYDEVKGAEAITKFSGKDSVNGEQYYLQLHHTLPGSGKPGKSGAVGANICGYGCGEGHVHVQIATGANLAGSSNWIDAGKEIKCSNYP